MGGFAFQQLKLLSRFNGQVFRCLLEMEGNWLPIV